MKLIKLCFGLLIFALAIWLLINWLHNKKETRELLSWIHVSVSEIDKSVPPSLLLEVENSKR